MSMGSTSLFWRIPHFAATHYKKRWTDIYRYYKLLLFHFFITLSKPLCDRNIERPATYKLLRISSYQYNFLITTILSLFPNRLFYCLSIRGSRASILHRAFYKMVRVAYVAMVTKVAQFGKHRICQFTLKYKHNDDGN